MTDAFQRSTAFCTNRGVGQGGGLWLMHSKKVRGSARIDVLGIKESAAFMSSERQTNPPLKGKAVVTTGGVFIMSFRSYPVMNVSSSSVLSRRPKAFFSRRQYAALHHDRPSESILLFSN